MSTSPIFLMEQAVRCAALKMIESIKDSHNVAQFRKRDRSWVLSLDLEANAVIRAELSGKSLPIVSEEEAATHALLHTEKSYFLVDPLDGTSVCRRFMHEGSQQLGFGPLVGLVIDGKIEAAVFANVCRGVIFSAQHGKGLTVSPIIDLAEVTKVPKRIISTPLDECILLFHIGSVLECSIAYSLREQGVIDNAYRFGGFANDSSRLALGYEEIQFQLSVCPWDLPATLLAQEAGFAVILDPLNTSVVLNEWRLKENNPVLVCPPQVVGELLKKLQAVKPDY
jgi:fructose-1,6-bisphosphatase/inositol monophosphatase family enzyme